MTTACHPVAALRLRCATCAIQTTAKSVPDLVQLEATWSNPSKTVTRRWKRSGFRKNRVAASRNACRPAALKVWAWSGSPRILSNHNLLDKLSNIRPVTSLSLIAFRESWAWDSLPTLELQAWHSGLPNAKFCDRGLYEKSRRIRILHAWACVSHARHGKSQ